MSETRNLLEEARDRIDSAVSAVENGKQVSWVKLAGISARIDAHLNTGGWISVEERPPTQSDGDKFGRILAVNPNAPRVIIWHWIDVADPKAEHTHWQPLPDLPEKTK